MTRLLSISRISDVPWRNKKKQLELLQTQLKVVEAAAIPRYMISDKYHKLHVTLAYVDVPVKLMDTYCGWPYDRSVYGRRSETQTNLAKSEKCPRCFDLQSFGVDSD